MSQGYVSFDLLESKGNVANEEMRVAMLLPVILLHKNSKKM